MKASLNRPVVLCLLALTCAIPVFSLDASFLAFVPKAERPLAVRRLSALDALSSAASSDRARAIALERESASRARVLEAAFDLARSGASADDMKLALHLADIPVLPIEGLAEELSKERSKRFALSLALSSGRYGSIQSTASSLLASGNSFYKTVAPYVVRAKRSQLESIAAFLESRVLSFPSCPRREFEALAAASRGLSTPDFQLWIQALSPCMPSALSSWDAHSVIAKKKVSADFLLAFDGWKSAFSSLRGLSDLWCGAAASAWYVDAVANSVKAGHPLLKAPSPEAVEALSRAVKLLPQALPAASGTDLEPAVAEISSILWVIRSRGFPLPKDSGFSRGDVDRALDALWSAVPAARVSTSAASRLEALERADAAVESLSACKTDRDLLALFAKYRADPAAFELLHRSARYVDIRKRISTAYSAAFMRAASRAQVAVIQSGFGSRLGRLVSNPQATTDGGIVFTLYASTPDMDPFEPLALSGRLELTRSDDVHFILPVPLELYARTVFSELPSASDALAVLPCFFAGARASPSELAWMASGTGLAAEDVSRIPSGHIIALVAARTGVPGAFLGNLPPDQALSILCSGPARVEALPSGEIE